MRFEDLEKYNFDLPSELIRKEGIEPRDEARLFVYDTESDTIILDVFKNLAEYLPEHSLLARNDTRVLPSRLQLTKETGGKIEVFVLANEIFQNQDIPVLVDRKVHIGQKLLFPNGKFFTVKSQAENIFTVRLSGGDLAVLLDTYGETPIPHYLDGSGQDESTLRKRYQTIFAANGASVAAPTAGLHFTDQVFTSLEKKGISSVSLTLNVGLGTFAPLRKEHFDTRRLHREYISVSSETAAALNSAKEKGWPIVAVGTTSLRTLESIQKEGRFYPYNGPTDIFLFPPHHFMSADILITNFHLPKSSLLLLVEAFLQDKKSRQGVLDLYRRAIVERFSFYSFGDSMLIK